MNKLIPSKTLSDLQAEWAAALSSPFAGKEWDAMGITYLG